MSLTVREAMEMEPLQQAKLLAGAGGVDREIISVNIIEVPDTARWMKGGELLFSAGFSFHGNADKGCELLMALNERRISALALKPGKYMHQIPQAMIDLADDLKFPLLELPEDMPYSTCMEAVYRRLLSGHLDTLEQIASLHSELLKAVVNQGSEGLRVQLSRSLGAPVYFVETGVRTLYPSPEAPAPTSAGQPPEEVLAHADTLYRSGVPETGITVSGRFLSAPVLVQGRPQGYLITEQRQGDELAFKTAGLQYAANLFAMEILKNQELQLHEQHLQGELLADLLERRCADTEITYRRGLLLGFDLKLPFAVFALRLFPSGNAEAFLNQSEKFWSEFQQSMKQYAAGLGTGVMFTRNSSSFFGILSLLKGQSVSRLQDFLAALNGRLLQTYPAVSSVIGLGRSSLGIERIPDACEEAQESAKVLSRVKSLPPVSSIDDLGIYRILIELENSPVMRNFYENNVRVISEYDSKGGMFLMDTLACYFENNSNLRATSEALFLHKNSVSYRLRKIEELIGHSLSDPSVSLCLQICLKYRNIL